MKVLATLEKINNGFIHNSKDGKRFYKSVGEFMTQNMNFEDIERMSKKIVVGESILIDINIRH